MAESSANALLTQFHRATSLIQDSLVGRRRSAQSIDAFKSSIVEFDIAVGLEFGSANDCQQAVQTAPCACPCKGPHADSDEFEGRTNCRRDR